MNFYRLLMIMITFAVSQPVFAEVNVYTSRNEHLVKPVFEQFEKETKIKVKYLTDNALPLIERIKSEGKAPKADVLLTVDAGVLWYAGQQGVLQSLDSKTLATNIPKHLRDPKNQWFGYSVRARTIVYSTKRVKPEELSTYEDLGSSKWKKRLCLRTSKKIYNQSLAAMLISTHGEKKAEEIVSSWVGNLATKVFSNDTRLLEAIAAGQCDVGIVNTYYLGRILKEKPDFPVAIFWPNQKTEGVHVNVSGAGLVKGAKNSKDAKVLLEWLSTPKAQSMFADVNFEYPVNPNVKANSLVVNWGDFKQNLINVSKAGELQAEAVKMMDRAGYK